MKKGLIYGALLTAVLLGAMPVSAAFSGGDGSKEAPYLLSSGTDLRTLAAMIADGDTSYAAAFYRLTDHVTAGEDVWTPIGTKETPFEGCFDGGGYTISDMTFTADKESEAAVGVFGYAENAVFEDVRLENIKISLDLSDSPTTLFAGTLCGRLTHTDAEAPCGVNGCVSESYALSVSGEKAVVYAGGLIGQTEDQTTNGGLYVTNVYASGTTVAETPYFAYVGGVIGQLRIASPAAFVDVERCIAKGTVSAVGEASSAYVGGVIGYAWKDAEDDASDSDTDATDLFADCTLQNDAKTAYLGSICGYAFDTVFADCYAVTEPIVSSEKYGIGGIAADVEDCASLLELDTESVWFETDGLPKLLMRGDVKCLADDNGVSLVGRLPQNGLTVAGLYDENGRMIGCLILSADGTGRFTKAKTIETPAYYSIFMLQNDTTLIPTAKPITGTVAAKKG